MPGDQWDPHGGSLGALGAPGGQKVVPQTSKSMILVSKIKRGAALAPPRGQPKTLRSASRKLGDENQGAENRAPKKIMILVPKVERGGALAPLACNR